jgi:hypothetical protein
LDALTEYPFYDFVGKPLAAYRRRRKKKGPMKQDDFPQGWDEEKVQRVLAHYEGQTEVRQSRFSWPMSRRYPRRLVETCGHRVGVRQVALPVGAASDEGLGRAAGSGRPAQESKET